jgi:nitrite reductase (NADH) large subunit
VERLGIEKVRKETVYAPEEEKRKLLDRLNRSKALSQDAWLERDRPATATQFVQIEAMQTMRETQTV